MSSIRMFIATMMVASVGLVVGAGSARADFSPDQYDAGTAGTTGLFSANFTGTAGTVPAGWTTTGDPATTGWSISNTAQTSGNAGLIPVVDGGFMWHEDSDGGSPVLTSPSIDLTAAADPYLTFDVHSYLAAGDEGNQGFDTDKSLLQVNVVAPSGTTRVFEISDTDRNGTDGWLSFTVRLADFTGDSIQLQFVYVDGQNVAHDIAIDNVEVVDVAAPDGSDVINDAASATYFLPISSSDVSVAHTHLHSNVVCGTNVGPQDTVTEYTSIVVGGTDVDDLGNPLSALVIYDHVEDGFGPSNRRTQATTELWGDGDPSNGFAPGHPEDLLFPGEVIILETVNDPGIALQDDGSGGLETAVSGAEIQGHLSTQQYDLNDDAGDRLTSPTGLVMSRVAWNDGSSTLLAGAVEVSDTSSWGNAYEMPIGEDLVADGTVADAFEYVGASIMARANGTAVTLPDGSSVTLDAGQTYFVDGGIEVGDEITSTGGSVSVNLIAGETCSNFQGRWFRIDPVRLFDSLYYSSVSGTNATNGSGNPLLAGGTSVMLYNPNGSSITVDVFDEAGADGSVTIPAGDTAEYFLTDEGSGASFESTDGSPFYAVQVYDTDNTARDWGYALLGLDQLSPTVQAGFAAGVDPTSGDTANIYSPIWVTGVYIGPGDPFAAGGVTICIDWNGDGGPNTIGGDPSLAYDVAQADAITGHLDDSILDEADNPPTNDLTGTKVFVCNPADASDPNLQNWLLAAAWGQDPTGPGGSPSIDVGTAIFNLPTFAMDKELVQIEDDNDNGITDVGDTIRYGLTVTNTSGVVIPADRLKVWDNLPAQVDYIEGSAVIEFADGTTAALPDDVGGVTAFPLDDADSSNLVFDDPNDEFTDTVDDGVWYDRILLGGGSFRITFDAEILEVPPNNVVINVALVTDSRSVRTDQVSFEIPESITIGNRVWLDEDGDGAEDAGEDGIADVPVTLTLSVPGQSDVVFTTTTDGDGGYLFGDLPVLPDGATYTVTIDPQGMDATGDEDGTADNTTVFVSDPLNAAPSDPLAIQPGEQHLSADFGLNWVPPVNTDDGTGVGAIGDRVWADTDGDGVQDPGEAGIADVTVRLFIDDDGDGVYDTPAGTAVTDANGNYVFDDLPAGAYVVAVDPSTLPADVTQTGDPDDVVDNASEPIVLAPGDVYVNADFGYQPAPGSALDTSIGDLVWVDGNGDGIADADEPPLPGVSVVLLDANGDVVATDLTDTDGNYDFTGVPPGEYTVWVNDVRNIAGELAPISDPDGTLDRRSDVTLAPGEAIDTVDFGFAPPASDATEGLVGDTVFLDRNGDGVPQPGEGIEGVRMEIYDEFDRLVGTTSTNALGFYAFGDLEPTVDGQYTVRVDASTLPPGVSQTVDPDASIDGASSTPLGADEQIYTLDFGYVAEEPVELSGTVWEDLDADGVLDPDEADRFAGVTISLVQIVEQTVTVTDPTTGESIDLVTEVERVVGSTVTDASGNYSFDDLAPGDYEISVIDADNVLGGYWHSDAPTPGTDGQSQNDEGYPVTLVAGSDDTTGDFGYYLRPGAVGDTVFEDSNANGEQDTGEPGIEGALVQLDITYPDGTVTTLVERTDAAGNYLFDGLLLDEDYNGNTATAGADEPTYVVSVIELPTGYADAVSTDPLSPVQTDSTVIGGSTASDGDADDPAGEPAFPGQAQTDGTNDFGFVTQATIGDFVFEDLDGDGVQDSGEPGIGGVTVNLYDASGALIDTVVTSSAPGTLGEYEFTGLLPGTYQVGFVEPDGFDFTDPTQGGDPSLDSDADPTTGRTGDIVLDPGENDDTIDAGLYVPVSIGDRVFNDSNGDGIDDGPATNPGIVDVTVSLFEDTTGDGVVDTLITTVQTSDGTADVTGDGIVDPAGTYLFDGLAPGTYAVVVDTAAGSPVADYEQTVDPDATLDDQTTTPITLASGESNTDQDFGYFRPATIGDRVFYDENNDGIQTGAETGLDGVTVELLDSAGTVVDTQVTAGGGFYLFEDVPAGDYTVVVDTDTLPAGFDDAANSFDPDGPAIDGDSEADVTVAEGDNIDTVDFGYFDPGTIGDTVFNDVDGDGTQDTATEPGIGNVTVNLYLDDDGTPGLSAGDTQVDSVTTNPLTGGYLFTDLPDGNYLVEVDTATLPAVFLPARNSADPDLAGSDKDNLGDSVSAVDLDSAGATLAGQSDLDQDFGYFVPASVGDRVFEDVDGDGIDDGQANDPGIAGVTVDLLDDTAAVVATTVTSDGTDGNPAGFYEFTNLAPGDYTVRIDESTLPAGSVQTVEKVTPGNTLDGSTDQTLTAGDDIDDVDFGYFRPSTVGDFVFDDLDADGIQDPGEPGVGGVVVELLDESGVPVATTVTGDGATAPLGFYEFADVVTGDYSVRFTAPDGRDFSPADQGGDDAIDSDPAPDSDGDDQTETTAQFTVPPATDIDTVDAGLLPPGALGDFVWADTNNDGVQDAGEPGIPGASVDLLDAAGDPALDFAGVAITTTTDAFGAYLFENLPAGEYRIRVTAPATDEWLVSPQNIGDDATDSDIAEIGDGIGLSDVATVGTTLNDTVDAGFVPAASIGDFVFGDIDNDGIQDADEDGVSGVTVNLYADVDGDGSIDDLVDTDVTDANGAYLFDDLGPDVYVVEFVAPDGTIFSPQDALGNLVDEVDSDPNAAGLTDPITIVAGQDDDTIDAGLVEVSVIGDFVFDDLDGDGVQDATDPGVAGVTVELLDDAGALIDTVVTSDGTVDLDGDGTPEGVGEYLFTDVVAGDYTVRFVAPAGRLFSPADQAPETVDSDPAADGTVDITVIAGVDDLTIDAGLLPTGALGDFVWSDTNNDGIQDDGEPGIEGATVELLDAAGDPVLDLAGDPITTTTDAAGAYLFTDLPAGDYRIRVTPPATDEWLVSTQNAGGDDTVDSDIGDDGLSDIATVGTVLNDTVDAGFVPAASIGDLVFDDADNNGIQDGGEAGIPGVTVNLLDEAGNPLLSDVTDASGEYGFTGLVPGTYVVEFVAPDGTIFSPQDAAGPAGDAVDSDPDADGLTGPVTLVAGQDDDTVDAGLVPTGSIGDLVFNDVDGDGIQDAGEPGIPGVTVELLNPDGSPVLDDAGQPISAITDGAGEYLFDDLAPGNYVVRFGDTDGTDTYLRSPANTTNDAVDSDADPVTGETSVISLAPGEDDTTVDAGLVLPSSITGTVEEDVNGDGSVLTPIGGVTVTLYEDTNGDGIVNDGVAGVPTTTEADGSYSFDDLLPGDYIVVETTPPGLIDVSDQDTTPDGDPFDANTVVDDQIAVQLDQGETDDGNDFVDLRPDGAVTIEKTTNGDDADTAPGPLVAPGSTIDWSYTVTNTGNIPLSEVVVIDDQGVAVDCGGVTTLAVGQTIVCTGSGTAIDGQYTNLGSVSTLEGPNDSDPSNYFGVVADIAVNKTVALGTSAAVDCSTVTTDNVSGVNGTPVTYCITVTNTGNVPLQNVVVDDVLLGFNTTIALLAPGESQTFVLDDTIDGDLTNTATATGDPLDVLTDPGNPTIIDPNVAPAPSDDDDASVNETPTFTVQKDNDADGDGTFTDTETQPITPAVVPFQVVITNTGGQNLTFVGIADVVDGAVRDFTDLACTNAAGAPVVVGDTISEGDTVTCTFSALVDLSVDAAEVDTISVILADETGQVQQTDDSTVLSPPRAELGGVVYEDTNGNDDQDPAEPGIADATVTLVPPAGVDLGDGPGVPIVLNVSDGTEDVDGDGNPDPAGTYYADDLLPGTYTVDVTLPEPYAQFEDPDAVRDDSTDVPLAAGGSSLDNDFGYAQPTLDIEKSTNGIDADDPTGPFVATGGDVTWTYLVTNTGVVPVTDVVVDDAPAPVSGITLDAATDVGADGVLSPGETWTFTATGTAEAGQFENVADATGDWTDSTGTPQSVTSDEDESHYYGITATIDVDKTVAEGNGADCGAAGELVTGQNGDLVTYCFLVTNTGNTLLQNVTLTDADLGIALADATFVSGTAPVAGQLDLAPGESALYSYDSAIDGDLVNTAEVSGTPVDDITDPGTPQAFPPESGIVPPVATDTAEVAETPTFTVDKTNDADGDGTFSDTEQQTDSPDVEPFQVVITNDGAEPLSVVSITDSVDGVERAFTDLTCVDELGAAFDPAIGQIGVADDNDSITCSFTFEVDLRVAASETDTITVVLADDDGNEVPGDDTSTVNPPDPAELGGVVYEDRDGNGTQDPTDPGIVGAEVTVTPPADVDLGNGPGNPVVLPVSDGNTDVTGDGVDDPAGTYYLGGLLPGDYDVEVTLLPEAYQQIEDPDAVVDNATTVTLVAGDSSLDNDFGYAQPTLDIEKSTTTDLSAGPQDADDPIGPFATTGTDVTWTYTVTNTGFVDVTDLTVTDAAAVGADPSPTYVSGDTNDDGVMEPGEVWIFSATGTAIAGQYTNTAQADGAWTDSDGDPQPVMSDQDSSNYFGLDADIQIDKTVALGSGQACPGVESVSGDSGDAVTYCFQIENTGNVILQDVTLVDGDLGIALADTTYVSGVEPLAGVLTLAPGDVSVFGVDATIEGDLTNTATASGTPMDTFSNPGAPPVPFDPAVVPAPTDSDTAAVDELPTFTVDKLNDANGDGTFAETEAAQGAITTVPFEVTITNDGVDALTFTSITDTVAGLPVAMDGLTCAPVAVGGQIPGGTSTTCSFTRTVDVSATGIETDVVDVVLSDLDGSDPTTQSDDSTVTGAAELSIVKTFVEATDTDADGTYDVVYDIVVSNAGTTNDVYDLSDEPQFDADLTVTGGSATATSSSGANVPAADGTFALPIWQIETGQAIDSGETHTYTLTFTVDASALVADPALLDPCDPDDPNPGEALFNEASITSDAGTVADDACGEPPLPVIDLDKTFVSAIDADDDGIYDVVYTVTATNTGDENGSYTASDTPSFDADVTITGGTATAVSSDVDNALTAPADFVPADGVWPLASDQLLEPGETHTFTLSFLVDASGVLDDPAAFQPCADTPVAGEGLFNAATLSYGDVVRNDDACGNLPSLSIDKQDPVIATDLDGDGEVDLGDTLTYTILVTNSGATPLTGVTMSDTIIDSADISCVRADDSAFDQVAGGDLAIGEVITCTGTYVVTEGDVIAGEIENTATADSNETPPTDDTVVTPIPPAVTISKVAGAPVSQGDGQFEITYTIEVGNTGAAGTYTLTDALQFGGGITIDSQVVTNTTPGTIETNAGWDGQGVDDVTTGPVALAYDATHIYAVTVLATVDPAVATPADLDCPEPGTGASGAFANSATVTMDDDVATDDACVQPPAPDVDIAKTVTSGPTLLADGTYQIEYQIQVSNLSNGVGTYDLTDELRFGGGITVVSSSIASTDPVDIPIVATWTGLGDDTLAVDDEPITALEVHTFQVVVVADAIGLETPAAGDCSISEPPSPGGFLNVATVVSGPDVATDDDCREVPPPGLGVSKFVSAGSPAANADGTYDIAYTIEVTNTGTGPGTYDLQDTLLFGEGIQVLTAGVTSTDVPNDLSAWDGVATTTIVTDVPILGVRTHTYMVVVTADLPATVVPVARDCNPDLNLPGTGFLNLAELVVGGEIVDDGQACVEAPAPTITVTKSIPENGVVINPDGSYSVTYDVLVQNVGPADGQYELDDELTFGDGITIDTAAVTQVTPDTLVTNPAWDGQAGGDPSITVAPVAIDGTDDTGGISQHTYRIVVTGSASGLASETAGDCTLDQGESGTGFLNTATITVDGVESSDDACDPNPDPDVSIDKTLVSGPVLNDDGTYTLEYQITVTNAGGLGTYDLSDELRFGDGITPTTATVANTAPGDITVSDTWNGIDDLDVVTAQAISAGAGHTYLVAVDAAIDPVVFDPATDAACPPPGDGTNGGFLNVATITVDDVETSDDACTPPPVAELSLAKTVTSGPTDLGDGTYSITYDLVVSNQADGPDAYDLSDELRFGAGITIIDQSVTNVLPGDIAVSGTWNGLDDRSIVTAEPIAGQSAHTYQVTVVVDALTVVTTDDTVCADGETLEPGGLLNVATIASDSFDGTADDCGEPLLPDISVAKAVQTGPTEQAGNPGVYAITYDIVVTNGGAGSGRYDLADDLAYGTGITVLQASVGSADVTTDLSAWNGSGQIVTDEALSAGASHTYTVSVEAQLAPGTLPAARDCSNDPGENGTGLLNVASVSGPLVTPAEADACAPLPEPDIDVAKSVASGPVPAAGALDISYDIVVTNAGLGLGEYSVTDALDFGPGITVVSASVDSSDVDVTGTTWNGLSETGVIDGVALAGSASHTYTVDVRVTVAPGITPEARDCVDGAGEDGTGLLNRVSVIVPGVDVPATDTACEELPDPDLSITKTVASGPTLNADGTYTIRYTVTARNTGDGPGLYDLVDRPAFGPAIAIQSSSVTSSDVTLPNPQIWSPQSGAPTVARDIGIAAGATQRFTMTFVTTIDPQQLNGTFGTCTGSHQTNESEFFNRAEIVVGTVVDFDDACASPPPPDLTIEKTVDPTTLTPRVDGIYEVEYTITVRNTGSGPANYELTDRFAFASGVTVLEVEVTEKPGSVALIPGFDGASQQRIADGSLAAGASHQYKVKVTVDTSAVRNVLAFDCTLDAGETGTGLLNRATVNPTAEACVPIPRLADLELAKTVDRDLVDVGSEVTFTIFVTNTGPTATTGVTVRDLLPDGLTYVSDTGDYNRTTGIWTIGDLAVGASATLDITVRVDDETAITNIAQVWTSDIEDPDSTPGNSVAGEDDQGDATVTGREVVVIEPPPPPPVTLPPTGGGGNAPIKVGVWMLLAGAGLLAIASRRRYRLT